MKDEETPPVATTQQSKVTIPDLIRLETPAHGVIFDPKGELTPLIAARKKDQNS